MKHKRSHPPFRLRFLARLPILLLIILSLLVCLSAAQGNESKAYKRVLVLFPNQSDLPDAWQVGMTPTITNNHQALAGSKWNVPVGLFVRKTLKIGNMPPNIKAGAPSSGSRSPR
jgi:hypothetical protein